MEKKEILVDWKKYIDGDKRYSMYDFTPLFKYQFTEEDFDLIYEFFPNEKNELVEKYKKLVQSIELEDLDMDAILELIKKDLAVKSKICKEMNYDDISSVILNAEYVFLNRELTRDERSHDNNVYLIEAVGDYISDTKRYELKAYYGLAEAYYGFNHNFHLSWYLIEPLIDTDYDLSAYGLIWRHSYDYVLADNKVLIGRCMYAIQ